MAYTMEERETIIRYDETPNPATIYTNNRALQRRLDAMAQECPDLVKIVLMSSENGNTYEVPKVFVRVNRPRTVNMSPEQKAEKAAILAAGRAAKQKSPCP